MRAIGDLFASLFTRTRRIKFTEFENRVIRSFVSCLPRSIRETVEKQIALINKLHRSPDGREVDFWRMSRGRPKFYQELSISDVEVIRAAKIKVSKENETLLFVRIYFVRGLLFSLEYDRPILKIDLSHGIDYHCHIDKKFLNTLRKAEHDASQAI